MSHIQPPARCSSNVFSWGENIVADETLVKKSHTDELRANINIEFARRFLSQESWSETLVVDQTKRRKIHLDELRQAIANIKSGRGESGYCPEDDSGCLDWTDPTITADSTVVRAPHMNEARAKLNALATGCICETEQCAYCADCGHAYQACSYTPCYCDNHKYGECGLSYYWVYSPCVNINRPSGVAFCSPTNTIPWDWCSYSPPGINWNANNPVHSPGYDHSEWGCKCNPFTWPTA